jgi:hypothetical protein
MSTDPNTTPAPEDLQLKLTQTQALLTEARSALASSQRTLAIERELVAHGALDLEAAAALIPTDADPRTAIADLKARKPFLFRNSSTSAAAMTASPSPDRSLDSAADHARQSGDRRDLLRYLRLKRSA